MKNCIVKMVVKNRQRPNPEDLVHSEPTEELLSSQTVNASRNNEQKEALGTQIKMLLGNFEKLLKEVSKVPKQNEIQPRDRKIVFQLPTLSEDRKKKDHELQVWITNLCNEVFSTAFHYFQRGNMSYDQTKIYCSQNLISNIIRLNQTYHLNSAEVKLIDQHIEDGVSPYLLTKYPMTESVVVNKALEGEIKQIDNIQALQNDIFFYSNDCYGFQYRQNGSYNDLIMKLVNDLMRRIDEKDAKVDQKSTRAHTFYEEFYDFMQTAFEKIESRDWMEGTTSNNSFKDDLSRKVDEQKYRARVKGYTSWAIGRKISQNVSQYTESEISSMHMTIKSPAILRILTKWCEQLWNKFDKKNYFLDRTENVKCQKGANVNTYFAWMKQIVNEMIEEEKVEIERFMEQVFANNYDQQAIHCFRSLKGNSFSHVQKYEKAAGIFTINIVNNLHSYILLYLNRLLHGLLKVSKRVYDRQLIGRARWNSPPNLISFKIGDLMRCKIGSQEKEILRLFRHFSDLSEKQPTLFKIIRIKNRLKEGTNDILMNIRFKNVFICQAQLAVNSDHSNFIKCSNKYNHFIYEVKRSIFGPISELCSIWRSLDGRCKVYQKMAQSKKQHVKEVVELKSGRVQQDHQHTMIRYFQPFVCSTCHQSYSHCNYIWSHHRCQECNFTQCCKCKIAEQSEDQLKQKLFKNNEKLKGFTKKLRDGEDIPKYGVCFLIQSKQLYMQKFVKHNIKGKLGLYYRKKDKNNIQLITDLNGKKDIEAFKDKYIIFKFSVEQGEKIVSIQQNEAKNNFLLPKLVQSIYKKEKEFISLIGQNINDKNLEEILNSSQANRNLIRYLELPDNQITSIDFICKNFTNLNKLVLSRNQITNIEAISKLINLQHLNIRDNLIDTLPPALFGLFKLKSLNIRNNKLNEIPEDLSKLTNLTKLELNQLGLKQLPDSMSNMVKIEYVDLSKNNLGLIPQQLRKLVNLQHLGLSNNGIGEIPEWIGELSQLKELELNKNQIKDIPESLALLTKLFSLQLENNFLQSLSFKCPQSLNVITLNENKISQIGQGFFTNCKNLVKIELNSNEIKALPFKFGISCPRMKNLSLNHNKLSEIRPFLGVFLPALELLELNGNQFKQFPSAIISCTQLVELHLAQNPEYNDIIPSVFLDSNVKIEKIDFSGSRLNKIPKDIALASTLKRLNFSKTSISCQGLEVLQGLKFIEQLILASMKLPSLPKALKMQHALHILNVQNNELTELDDDFFTRLTHLRSINFSKNKLKSIPESFKACKRIKSINFDSNLIAQFPPAIFNHTKIEKIKLSNNLIEKIESEVPLPPKITIFDIRKNNISYISNVIFMGLESLSDLNLSSNKLKSIPSSLKDCANLKITDFNQNPIQFIPEETVRETLVNFVSFNNQANYEEDTAAVDKESLMNTYLG